MKKIKKISILGLICLLSPISYAAETYVVSANGNLVKNNFGECWVSSGVKVPNQDCGDPPPPPPPPKKFQPKREEVFNKNESKIENLENNDNLKLIKTVLYFEENSAAINDQSEQKLLSDILALKPFISKVEIVGHADSRGKDQHNKNLSIQRADSVAEFIKNKGIASNKVNIFAQGSEVPSHECATNKKSCLEKNRRVEVVITISDKIQK